MMKSGLKGYLDKLMSVKALQSSYMEVRKSDQSMESDSRNPR